MIEVFNVDHGRATLNKHYGDSATCKDGAPFSVFNLVNCDRTELFDRTSNAVQRRRVQRSIFPPAVFRESCWDIMLLCFLSQLEGHELCIKQVRNQIDESDTAVLRRIDELERAGMVERIRDVRDARRTIVRLTRNGASSMARFITEVEQF